MPKQYHLYAADIFGECCANNIKIAFEDVKEVAQVDVDVLEQIVLVAIADNVDPKLFDLPQIKNILAKEDYPNSDSLDKVIQRHWIKGLIACLLGAAILVLSILGCGIPLIAMYAIAGVATLATIIVGKDTYKKAYQQLKLFFSTDKFKAKAKEHPAFRIGMEVLFALSTLLALGISLIAILPMMPFVLPMLFDTALLILGFHHVGMAIKQQSKRNLLVGLNYAALLPATVKVQNSDGILQEIDIANVAVKNVIEVDANMIMPVDAIYLGETDAFVYDTSETGNTSSPRKIKKGDLVLQGMVLSSQALKFSVTKTMSESALIEMDKNIGEGRNTKPAIQDLTETILKYFIPSVIGVALIASFIIGFLFTPALAILVGIGVLVSACPCILGIVAPLVIKIAMKKAIDEKVQFITARSIQAATEIDTIVFDYNGTLTQGKPTVEKFVGFKDFQYDNDFYQDILAIESQSVHAVGKAICGYLKNQPITARANESKANVTIIDSGISAKINNNDYVIGTRALLKSQGIDFNPNQLSHLEKNSKKITYVIRNKQLMGFFVSEDKLRDDAIPTIDYLRNVLKKKIKICSGDDLENIRAHAAQLGITDEKDILARCSKDKKSEIIKDLQAHGKVAMVGDNVNDGLALSKSDLGIFIRSEQDSHQSSETHRVLKNTTQANANVVIHDGSLMGVVKTFLIADKAMSNIKQGLAITFSYNLCAILIASGILLTVGFVFPPALGPVGMIVSAAIVFLNVYLFKQQRVEVPEVTKQLSEIKPINKEFAEVLYEDQSELKRSVSCDSFFSAISDKNEFIDISNSHAQVLQVR